MTRRALCVGVERFTDPQLAPLRGAVHDARTLSLMLLRDFGYDPRATVVLTNERATKAAVLSALEGLVAATRPGDDAVFFVSSYGSEIPDEDGDEGDGRDEVLVLHDHDWSRTVLTDDEIARVLAKLPDGARMATVWDTCHAGTLEDTASAAYRTRGLERDGEAVEVTARRWVPGPAGSTRAVARGAARAGGGARAGSSARTGGAKKPRARRAESTATATMAEGAPAVSLSGCDDDETSVEVSVGGIHEGAFTHCLLDVLRRTRDDLSWATLHARTRDAMKAMGVRQTPQLHAPAALRDAPAFGGRAPRVRATQSTTVTATQHATTATGLAAVERSIVAHESAGRWAEAITACWQRVTLLTDVAEKLRMIEHVASIYRVILRDEASALRVAEAALRIDPGHGAAREYVRGGR